MSATKLVQLKVEPRMKTDLEDIARYKGIPVTSFIKLVLTEEVRREKKNMITENGLTVDEELEILRREKELIALTQKKKSKKPLSAKALFNELDA